MNPIQAVRGMNDVLPDQVHYWQHLEAIIRQVMHAYAYQEIRLPLLESTPLFQRSIGDVTDIVEKEMYSFLDRHGESISLRPEGTAGCVRAGIEHGLLYHQIQRLWYMGPMFRYERPQKGRHRQFYQLGIEAYGVQSASMDVEIIALGHYLWQALGIEHQMILEINSLGNRALRKVYRQALVDFFNAHRDQLDENSRRRLIKNPLRILDSKNDAMQSLIQHAPKLSEYYDAESQQHFDQVCHLLEVMNIPYQINPCLVRGLDYYTHTVFEWVSQNLGAQGAVCAGGRYDELVEMLGGKPTPAVGCAMGFERVILILQQHQTTSVPDIYLLAEGHRAQKELLLTADRLRKTLGISVMTDMKGGRLKVQFKRANQSKALWTLMIKEENLGEQTYVLKNMQTAEQKVYLWSDLVHYFQTMRS